jgi:hypothetical protein
MTLGTLRMGILMLFAGSSLNGCGTVAPQPIEDNQPSFDSSTPHGYDRYNSGIINMVRVGNITLGAHITDNAKKRYNELINAYRLQFRDQYKILLNENDGIKESGDGTGNRFWLIDEEHLQYFMRLNRWSKEGKASDTLWMKTKELL